MFPWAPIRRRLKIAFADSGLRRPVVQRAYPWGSVREPTGADGPLPWQGRPFVQIRVEPAPRDNNRRAGVRTPHAKI